jgi:hypothetical protein
MNRPVITLAAAALVAGTTLAQLPGSPAVLSPKADDIAFFEAKSRPLLFGRCYE